MISVTGRSPFVTISGYQVTLEPLKESDIMQLRKWRNSDFVRHKMLSSETVSEAQQRAWFAKIKNNPRQSHWVIRYKNVTIGTTNLKTLCGSDSESVSESRVLEPGLYIGEPSYQGNLIAFSPTLALYDYCFEYLKINELHATVKTDNHSALKYNEKLGYEAVAQTDNGAWITLRITRTRYENATRTIKHFLSRQKRHKHDE